MAYSQKVVDRFNDVLKNPEKHSVGRFDPKDPMVLQVWWEHLPVAT